jgi:hypothetical protein
MESSPLDFLTLIKGDLLLHQNGSVNFLYVLVLVGQINKTEAIVPRMLIQIQFKVFAPGSVDWNSVVAQNQGWYDYCLHSARQ